MKIPLESLASCFQGLIPSTLYTCSKDGVPNAAMLSHVDYVDARHVGLSFQFFNKSRRNVAENPQALVRMYDPDTLQVYEMRLRFVRSETAGPLFESMALRIEAIASHTGLKGIFKLLAADVYEVLSVERAADEVGFTRQVARRRSEQADPVLFTMKALQELSDVLQRSTDLEGLLDAVLDALERLFGFGHAMILLPDRRTGRLVTIASRGYEENGVGSEVGIGEGIIGMVAEAKKPVRISGLLRQLLYAYAVARHAREMGLCGDERRIPLPGLARPDNQLGIPLLVREELIGVLCIESERSYRFHEEDKAYLEVLGSYVAIAIQNVLLRERVDEPETEPAAPQPLPPAAVPPPTARPVEVTYYRGDECILVDGEYLIRSLPARILWKLLNERGGRPRAAFTNRELRLDKALSLPDFKDNLESRLILLRKRLEQRCPAIRIVPAGRGRFVLDLSREVDLRERP